MNLLVWWCLLLLALWLGPKVLSIFSFKFKNWKEKSGTAEKLRIIRRFASIILIAVIPSIIYQGFNLKFNIWTISLQVIFALVAIFMILGAKGAPKFD